MLPNALVLAFDDSVKVEIRSPPKAGVDYSVPGELVISVDESLPDEEKPALIVDGQRSAAIRDADLAEFPVAAVGFIAATAKTSAPSSSWSTPPSRYPKVSSTNCCRKPAATSRPPTPANACRRSR
ncbi:hypothetical protein SHIRM173S_06590 [Streptomyces hirsutus]